MSRNNELKEIDTKNRTCYYFDDKTNINDLDPDNVLLNIKLYENILIHLVAYKTPKHFMYYF